VKHPSLRSRMRHLGVAAITFITTLGGVALEVPLHAYADCNGGGQGFTTSDPQSGGPYNYPNSYSEGVTYEWSDAEADDGGGASTGADWTFTQDYYVEGTWVQRNYCSWNNYPYPSWQVTQSVVDVEDGQGHPGGIQFAVDNVLNGSSMYEWYHQRQYEKRQKYNIKDTGSWQSGYVVDYDHDTYAEGRWNSNPPEAALWDPAHLGFVHTSSNDANGGVLADWGGYYVDYGY
jgi:hypothetical protein